MSTQNKYLTDDHILEMATDKLDISNPNPDKIVEIAELLDLELDPSNDLYFNPNFNTMKNFKFWKENRTDQEFTLNEQELRDKFKAFAETLTFDEIDQLPALRIVLDFFTSSEGLNSVFENERIDEITDSLKGVLYEVYDNKASE